jgi:hypothetical protein
MSDNYNTLHITLRDFRPVIVALAQAGHASLSQAITQDFVDAYAREFHKFVVEVNAIVAAPRAIASKPKMVSQQVITSH